jgi:hypothetical protein
MNEAITCQGRRLPQSDLCWLRHLVCRHPDWSRHKITQHICRHWGWQTPSGQLKTFAARSMIDKLEHRGLLKLPPIRVASRRNIFPPFRKGFMPPEAPHIDAALKTLTPLSIHIPTSHSYEASCVGYYLSHHHYLGFTRTVGEHLKYLVRDRSGQDLACLLFGSAAWKTTPRDTFIGWEPDTRAANLNFMTNNTRFLILPWVRVPHLASHLLGRVMRRLRQDWIEKYGHPVHLVETFVERDRFKGICYQAANWLYVGQTKGRSRQDRDKALRVPVKAIYLYPLIRHFRQALCRSKP